MEKNFFDIKSYQMLKKKKKKNGSRWVRNPEKMVDVEKSHIPNLFAFVVSSRQHTAEHCYEAKLDLVD